jgi:hypothetical protein
MHEAPSQPLLTSFLTNYSETGKLKGGFLYNWQNVLDFQKCAKLNRQILPSVLGFTACGRKHENGAPQLDREAPQTGGRGPEPVFLRYSYPVVRGQSENGKVEMSLKPYIKPKLRFLGLLRLLTKLSF